MQKKKISLGTVVSLMALTAAATFVITLSMSRKQFNQTVTEVDRLAEKYQRLDELDAKVREAFYQDVPEEDVLDGMLSGYVAGLGDKYSVYRSDRELSAYEDNNAGVYTGIGISVRPDEEGNVIIVGVTEGGSAEKAGIAEEDILLEVEGVSAKESYQEAISLINGEAGTSVQVRIKKHDTGKEQKLSLMRMKLGEVTVISEMLPDKIGYIRISKFRNVSPAQFETARQDLLKQGAKAFLFDVRDNGGGVVSALEKMVDPLLPEGELAFAVNRNGEKQPILTSDANCTEMPYAVLMNQNSASSSELFACVLRDYADAILVGEKSYGKGIMQTTFALSSGGLTITTSTIETGVTPCYHGVGLEPDVLSVYDPEQEEDNQIADAVDALKARMKTDPAA